LDATVADVVGDAADADGADEVDAVLVTDAVDERHSDGDALCVVDEVDESELVLHPVVEGDSVRVLLGDGEPDCETEIVGLTDIEIVTACVALTVAVTACVGEPTVVTESVGESESVVVCDGHAETDVVTENVPEMVGEIDCDVVTLAESDGESVPVMHPETDGVSEGVLDVEIEYVGDCDDVVLDVAEIETVEEDVGQKLTVGDDENEPEGE